MRQLQAALAAEPEPLLVVTAHQFEPAEFTLPAGRRIKFVVHNQDAMPEAFRSKALTCEKIIPGGAKATVFAGPLKPGRYARPARAQSLAAWIASQLARAVAGRPARALGDATLTRRAAAAGLRSAPPSA